MGIEGLHTINDNGNDQIQDHKNHDENVDVVPKIGTDSVVKPNLLQNVTVEQKKIKLARYEKLHP
jgi:hypothetical protein